MRRAATKLEAPSRTARDETGSGGDIRHFYYNEKWQCVAERVEASSVINTHPIKEYAYFPYYIDAVCCMWYDPDSDGSSVSRYHFMHDANMNVVAVATAASNSYDVVERYHYSPYGEVTILHGENDSDGSVTEWDVDSESDIGNEFLYTGRRLDPETGLQYSRYRYYHPQLGRFINRDPIGYASGDGLNLYQYVGSDPASYIDPMGTKKSVAKLCPAGYRLISGPSDPSKIDEEWNNEDYLVTYIHGGKVVGGRWATQKYRLQVSHAWKRVNSAPQSGNCNQSTEDWNVTIQSGKQHELGGEISGKYRGIEVGGSYKRGWFSSVGQDYPAPLFPADPRKKYWGAVVELTKTSKTTTWDVHISTAMQPDGYRKSWWNSYSRTLYADIAWVVCEAKCCTIDD